MPNEQRSDQQQQQKQQEEQDTEQQSDEDSDLDKLDELDADTLQEKTNTALDNFRETHSAAQQEFIANAYVESGVIPTGEHFGVTEAQARVVEAGFIKSMERDVFSQYGLTHSQWMDHVDEADLPTFRKAAMSGQWDVFHQHCIEVAKLRKQFGI